MTETLKEEIKNLNLKEVKDYIRFKTIRAELQEQYKDELQRGIVPDYAIIEKKEKESFTNYPTSGFEYYPSFKEHINKYYKGKSFENFEQEQYMYDDLMMQYNRRRVFNL